MKILIVEDDECIRWTLKEYIGCFKPDIHCFDASSIDEAIEMFKKVEPDIIFLDILLSGQDSGYLIQEFKKVNGKIPKVIVMSAWDKSKAMAEKFLADQFVAKPFDLDIIDKIIQ